MKKVLFIAHLYPPIANSGTRRSLEFANRLPDFGWQPIVVTVANPPQRVCDARLLDEVRPGTRIERVPLLSDVVAQRIARALAPVTLRQRVAGGLAWRLQRRMKIPDETACWYPTVLRRALQIHAEVGLDAIYATGWPWSSFLIARAVAQRIGRPYVLDYRDLWRSSGVSERERQAASEWEGQGFWQKRMQPRLERHAVRGAAAVVTTTESFARDLELSTGVRRVHCITNGFNPDDFSVPSSTGKPGAIVYPGIWRPGYGLQDLYAAVQKLKERQSPCLGSLKVITAGFAPGPAAQYGIEEWVQEMGPVPHATATSLMVNAGALFLPVPAGFYSRAVLPGKLFEYLGSGQPILAMAPAQSEVASVLSSVGGALRVDPGDTATLASVLERIYGGGDAQAVFSARRPDASRRFTRQATAEQLARLLDEAHGGACTARSA